MRNTERTGRFLHPAPEPDLDPAIEKKGDISGGVGGDNLLLRPKAAQLQDNILQEINQPPLTEQTVKVAICLKMGKHIIYRLIRRKLGILFPFT